MEPTRLRFGAVVVVLVAALAWVFLRGGETPPASIEMESTGPLVNPAAEAPAVSLPESSADLAPPIAPGADREAVDDGLCELSVLVLDQGTGLALAGVGLLLQEVESDEKLRGQSNADGRFRFVHLVPGKYSLEPEAAGMALAVSIVSAP